MNKLYKLLDAKGEVIAASILFTMCLITFSIYLLCN